MRPEHFQKHVRRVEGNERVMRLFVLDHMVNLIDDYISADEANRVQKLYMDWALDKDGNYNEFKQLFTEILAKAKDLPEAVNWRLTLYLEYLFPKPIPR